MTGVTGDVLVPRPSSPFVLLPKANTLPWGNDSSPEGKVLGEDRTRHTLKRGITHLSGKCKTTEKTGLHLDDVLML